MSVPVMLVGGRRDGEIVWLSGDVVPDIQVMTFFLPPEEGFAGVDEIKVGDKKFIHPRQVTVMIEKREDVDANEPAFKIVLPKELW